MKYNNELGIISAFLISLILTGLVLAYPVQINLQSNLSPSDSFSTFTVFCTDVSCSSFISGTEKTKVSDGNLNIYRINGTGNVSWVELDYKDESVVPHIYRLAATDKTGNGPFTVNRNFAKMDVCRANVNSVQLSSNAVGENRPLSVSTNIQSALGFPKDDQGRLFDFSMIPIPENLRSFYSTLTNVTFRAKNPNGNVLKTETKQVNPLMNKSENVSFDFTPPVQGDNYTVEIETNVVDPFCASAQAKTQLVNFNVTDSGPTANAGGNKTVNQGDVVSFDASATVSADPIVLYLWKFGDGNTDEGLKVNHTYQSPGTYTVTLRVKDSTEGQESTDTITVQVNRINQKPAANFAASATTIQEGQPVQFNDTSISPDGFKLRFWEFGDSKNSTEQNPSHIFDQQGTYTISLKVTDNDNDVSDPKPLNITVTDTEPNVNFVFTPAVKGQPVQFNDTTSSHDQISSRTWNFGDGSQSVSDPAPVHTFANAGTFNVTLTVKDNDGQPVSLVKTVTVADIQQQPQPPAQPPSQPPTVSLQSPTETFTQVSTQFAASATGSVTKYEWDFDYDGSFSAAPVPNSAIVSFPFDTPKTYRVAVRVTDSAGVQALAEKAVLVKSSNTDISVSSLTQSKASSTVFLFDTIQVTSNVSNLGSTAQNVTVKLKEGLVEVGNQTVPLGVGETKTISFNWTPQIKGFRTLKLEALQVSGETQLSNNEQTLQNIKVTSAEDSLKLTFANSLQFPKSTESKNSEFAVWVKVENKGSDVLKDVKLSLDVPLTVTDRFDHASTSKEKVLTLAAGESADFWWKVASGTGGSVSPKVFVGNPNDKVEVTRTVSIQ